MLLYGILKLGSMALNFMWWSKLGSKTLLTFYTNDIPMQMRWPAVKGAKLNVFRFYPLGVRLKGLLLSKRSGINLPGSIHSLGLLHICTIPWTKTSPLRRTSPPQLTSLVIWCGVEQQRGGWMRIDSFHKTEPKLISKILQNLTKLASQSKGISCSFFFMETPRESQ